MGRLETIRLDAQMEEFVDTQLRDGKYGSIGEVVDAALQLFRDRVEIEAIREVIIEGEQSGEPEEFDGEEFRSELHRKHVR